MTPSLRVRLSLSLSLSQLVLSYVMLCYVIAGLANPTITPTRLEGKPWG